MNGTSKTENGRIIEMIDSRRGELKTESAPYREEWRDITDFIYPGTAKYLRSERHKGKRTYEEIINETATLSLRTMESGFMAGMSSPARPWFVLGPPDPGMKEYGPVKEWLDIVTRLMRDVLSRSNAYSVFPTAYGSLGAYGTAAFAVLEDEEEVIRCYPFPIGSYHIACNDRMKVDTIYRETSMPVRQIVDKFGQRDLRSGSAKWDNISTSVKNLYERGSYAVRVPVVHAVEPNFSRAGGKLDARDKPFLSVYYEEGGGNKDRPLRISGFDDFPVMVPRWFVNGEDVWGSRCPAMLVLGSTKALQLEERRKYQVLDKHANPAMMFDATAQAAGVSLYPGDKSYIPGMNQFPNSGGKPVYEPSLNGYQYLSADIREVENRIKRAFYEDLMLMLATGDNSQMTAREVEERHQEKLLVLGPVMEQQNDDFFDPFIDRVFGTMFRRGMLPPPPPELQGKKLRVEYVSIMAQAQKLVGVSSVERFAGFVGSLIPAFPEARHKVDALHLVNEYGEMMGVPSKIIVPDDVAQEKLAAEAKQAQMAQMAASMPAAQQGADALKTLTDTNPEAINALIGQLTGRG